MILTVYPSITILSIRMTLQVTPLSITRTFRSHFYFNPEVPKWPSSALNYDMSRVWLLKELTI